jgi:SPRY domain
MDILGAAQTCLGLAKKIYGMYEEYKALPKKQALVFSLAGTFANLIERFQQDKQKLGTPEVQALLDQAQVVFQKVDQLIQGHEAKAGRKPNMGSVAKKAVLAGSKLEDLEEYADNIDRITGQLNAQLSGATYDLLTRVVTMLEGTRQTQPIPTAMPTTDKQLSMIKKPILREWWHNAHIAQGSEKFGGPLELGNGLDEFHLMFDEDVKGNPERLQAFSAKFLEEGAQKILFFKVRQLAEKEQEDLPGLVFPDMRPSTPPASAAPTELSDADREELLKVLVARALSQFPPKHASEEQIGEAVQQHMAPILTSYKVRSAADSWLECGGFDLELAETASRADEIARQLKAKESSAEIKLASPPAGFRTSEDVEKLIQFGETPFDIKYVASRNFHDFDSINLVSRGDPYAAEDEGFYFEVTVVSGTFHPQDRQLEHLGIGVVASKSAIAGNNSTRPWTFFGPMGSVGVALRSTGGFCVNGTLSHDESHTFGDDDVIGCGYNPATQALFFTKNGEFLQTPAYYLRSDLRWFMHIGFGENAVNSRIRVNVGPAFKFDLKALGESANDSVKDIGGFRCHDLTDLRFKAYTSYLDRRTITRSPDTRKYALPKSPKSRFYGALAKPTDQIALTPSVGVYFEVTIEKGTAGIGLFGRIEDMKQAPGMQGASVGFCYAADAYKRDRKYCFSASGLLSGRDDFTLGEHNAPQPRVGDTIGCGWNAADSTLFFTHNGSEVATQSLAPEQLHLGKTVSLAAYLGGKGSAIHINTGESDFKFNLAAKGAEVAAAPQSEFARAIADREAAQLSSLLKVTGDAESENVAALQQIFRVVDSDGSGGIDAKELQALAAKQLEIQLSDAKAQELVELITDNPNADEVEIEIDAFVRFFKTVDGFRDYLQQLE